jgi:hypothetical protein
VKVYSNTAFISLLGDKERVLYHGEYTYYHCPGLLVFLLVGADVISQQET